MGIIYEGPEYVAPHVCQCPQPYNHRPETIWECDECGQYWQARGNDSINKASSWWKVDKNSTNIWLRQKGVDV